MRSKIWTDSIVQDNRFQLIIGVVNAHVRAKLLPTYCYNERNMWWEWASNNLYIDIVYDRRLYTHDRPRHNYDRPQHKHDRSCYDYDRHHSISTTDHVMTTTDDSINTTDDGRTTADSISIQKELRYGTLQSIINLSCNRYGYLKQKEEKRNLFFYFILAISREKSPQNTIAVQFSSTRNIEKCKRPTKSHIEQSKKNESDFWH